jgi:16S rRNA (cytosine1402-N4)-methyltransferase
VSSENKEIREGVHQPVLLEEVLEVFSGIAPMKIMVDGTLGAGGHARVLLERCVSRDGILLGFDQDGEILKIAKKNLEDFSDQVKIFHRNAIQMGEVLRDLRILRVDGVLLDLGVSSLQLDTAERGFSFLQEAALDMRMDVSNTLTAYDVVNGYAYEELKRVFREYSDERHPGGIAKKIVSRRENAPIRTTKDLAELFVSKRKRIHPATTIFQAIRIEVNNELKNLEKILREAFALLRWGGRLAVIAFHSLEDRIVKSFFREKARACVCPKEFPKCVCGGVAEGFLLTAKPIQASEKEIAKNPRARSAKMRVICSTRKPELKSS